jgi:thiamine biosynthesis lipoprotein
VTSGIYERYFVQNGRLYAHILDPRTGYPVENNLSSVTIVSDESKQGDGLSATCFLLGVEKATRLVESLHNVEAIFITKDGKVVTTPGINKTVKFVPAAQAGKESQPAAAS